MTTTSSDRATARAAEWRRRSGDYRRRANHALAERLPDIREPPRRLHEAMHYAVLGGGKRVRAIMVYAAADAAGCPQVNPDAAACAVEFVHAYSLVHDDLPAMDDDDLRRGRPTCHRAFDEATALLAGDALQTLAFEVLSSDRSLRIATELRCRMLEVLSRAVGSQGMAGGQAIDLAATGRSLTLEELEGMHLRKTGALIRASVRLGALCASADEEALEGLDAYAQCVGLAFQIRDDVLDVEGDTAVLGKAAGADSALGKPTYPSVLGLAESRRRALALHERALARLSGFGASADTLRMLSEYVVTRKR